MTREEQIDKQSEEVYPYDMRNPHPYDERDLQEAFFRGAEWADNNPNWVKCDKDHLPKRHYQKLILITKDRLGIRNMIFGDFDDADGYGAPFFSSAKTQYISIEDVMYWMYAPVPPKKGGDK